MYLIRCIYALLALLGLSFAASADELPVLAAGDSWTYVVTTTRAAGAHDQNLVQFMVVADDNGGWRIRSRSGTRGQLIGENMLPWPADDGAGVRLSKDACLFDPRGSDLGKSQAICHGGLQAGATWSTESNDASVTTSASLRIMQSGLIVNHAGAFNGINIEWLQNNAGDPGAVSAARQRASYWYSAQVKSMLRMSIGYLNEKGGYVETSNWELNDYHVSGTKPDLDLTEIQRRTQKVDTGINEQIGRYLSCRSSDEHRLSETASGIAELKRFPDYQNNSSVGDALKTLFATYQSLGGSGTSSADVTLLPDPCIPIATALKSFIDTEAALHKSEDQLRVADQSNTDSNPAPNKPVINFQSCASPRYPRVSLLLEEQGKVRMAFLVGAYGVVNFSFVAVSSGYPVLDDTALEALSKCHFSGADVGNLNRPMWATVDYVFKLTN